MCYIIIIAGGEGGKHFLLLFYYYFIILFSFPDYFSIICYYNRHYYNDRVYKYQPILLEGCS
jgi:hypothetical protein